jgi:hypothetical protein
MFAADSIWSIVLRGAVWFIIALVIIISADNPNPEKSLKTLKSNLGFFLMFIILSGGLIYLLFGFNATSTSI